MKPPSFPLFTCTLAFAIVPLLPTARAADEVIDGGGSTSVPGTQGTPWTIDGKLTVGGTGAGTLTIGAGGEVTSVKGVVGQTLGSNGSVTVSGAGAKWTITDTTTGVGENGLIVGADGTGSLNISNGGSVSSAQWVYIGGFASGSTTIGATGVGSATVTGAGSTLAGNVVYVGGHAGASGELTISAGGKVTSTTISRVGWSAGVGTALLTGAGSEWTVGSLFTLQSTGSSLTIQNGADMSIGTTSSFAAGTNTLVTGTGSSLTTGTSMTTGAGSTFTISAGATSSFTDYLRHDGSLVVEGGGKLDASGTGKAIHVGYNTGVTASVKVTGAGSEWSSASEIIVSRLGSLSAQGYGSITIADGGKVTVNGGAGKITLAAASNTNGVLNIGEGGAAGVLAAAEVASGTGTGNAQVNFNHTGTTTFSANLTGTRLAVTKTGSGITVLNGTNTYSLATTINGGTLLNNGSLGTTAITVANTATYGGTGTHAGALTIQSGGHIAPGAGVGILNTGSLNLIGQAIYQWEISDAGGVAGGGWDTINVAGTATIDSTGAAPFTLELLKAGTLANFDASQDHSFIIATAGGGISGLTAENHRIDATGIPEAAAGSWSLNQSGNSLVLSYHAVPEPSVAVLGLIGSLALLRRRR